MWLHDAQIPRIPSKSTTSWTDMQEHFPPQLRRTWGVRIFERGCAHSHSARRQNKCNLAREKRSAICYYYRWKYFWIPHEWLFAYHLQQVNIKWKRSWIVYSLISVCARCYEAKRCSWELSLWRHFWKQCCDWKSHGPVAAGLSEVAVT